MSHNLAVAKSPVFASFRAKGSRSSARSAEAEGAVVEHRLDLLMDRLEQLEFTFTRLFDTDIDGHEDDRLAQIETRLHAMHDQLAVLAENRRAATALDARLDAMQDMLGTLTGGDAAIDALAEDMGTRHDALLDTLSSLATTDEQEANRLAQSLADQQRQFDTLQQTIASLAERVAPPQADEGAILQAIADLATRQAAAQAQMNARFASQPNALTEDAFAALSFRVSRMVDARMAAGFAGLADALERAIGTPDLVRAPAPLEQPAAALDDTHRVVADTNMAPNGGDRRVLIDELARACRSASAADRTETTTGGA